MSALLDECLLMLSDAASVPALLGPLADRLAESGDAVVLREVLRAALPARGLRLGDLVWTERAKKALAHALDARVPSGPVTWQQAWYPGFMPSLPAAPALASVSRKDLLAVPGCGKLTARRVEEVAAALGVTLKE